MKIWRKSFHPLKLLKIINNQILSFNVKPNFLKNSFFPAVITECNNLVISIHNSSSCYIFKNLILKFIRPEPNRISSTQDFEGLKLLTRMRLGLSYLADHKFTDNFQDCSRDRNNKPFPSSLSELPLPRRTIIL